MHIDGIKVFSVTKARDREYLSETINDWIRANPDIEVVEQDVIQSSDWEFHCVSVVLLYRRIEG